MSALSNELLLSEPHDEEYTRMSTLDRDPNYRVHRVADILEVRPEQARTICELAQLLETVPETLVLVESAIRSAQTLHYLALADELQDRPADADERTAVNLAVTVGGIYKPYRVAYTAMRKRHADDAAKPV